jgi:putative hydrolase of the HAD superfamily
MKQTMATFEDIKAICIDLDDTLWPIEPVIREAEKRLHDWLASNCPDVTEGYSIDDLRELRSSVTDAHPERAHDFTWLRRRSLRRVLREYGYADEYVDTAFEVFLTARHDVTLFDDVLPGLKALASRYPLACLSNGNADVNRIGLNGHFRFSLSAREVGQPKPHRAMFDEACRRFELQAHEVLHAGDHPVQDIDGAADAGLRTVWVNRNGTAFSGNRTPDREVDSLSELAEIL